MSVYLRLFHGRDTVDETLDDWGYEGPKLGPWDYVHITYASDVKYTANGVDGYLRIVNELVEYEGKYYGDMSITSD